MNSLSWIIYFADVVGRVAFLSGVTAVLLTIGFCVLLGCIMEWKSNGEGTTGCGSLTGLLVFLIFLFTSIGIFTPSKQALYLIAGSQASEAVITSDAGQQMLSDIQSIIKQQLKVKLK